MRAILLASAVIVGFSSIALAADRPVRTFGAVSSAAVPPLSAACPVKICSIHDENYDPSGPDDPVCPQQADQIWVEHLANVILRRAPSLVEQSLCRLDSIFVLKARTESWGKWSRRGLGKSYIGITTADMSTTLKGLEDNSLESLTKKAGRPHDTKGLDFEPQVSATLAILAHELAHLKFRRDNIKEGPGSCFKTAFVGQSWTRDTPYQDWLPFGVDLGAHKNNVPKAKTKAGREASEDELYRIYTEGFATALASQSPEEDFVEAFKLRTLMNAKIGPKKLWIKLLGQDLDVTGPRGEILAAKLACAELFFGPPK